MKVIQQSTVAVLQERLGQLKEAKKNYQNVLLGKGYIVRVGMVHLRFTITSERLVTDPVSCRVESADLFAKEDAEAIAANSANGRGEVGQAIHVKDAIEEEIAMVESLLADLN
jgi:hypothetical protein